MGHKGDWKRLRVSYTQRRVAGGPLAASTFDLPASGSTFLALSLSGVILGPAASAARAHRPLVTGMGLLHDPVTRSVRQQVQSSGS